MFDSERIRRHTGQFWYKTKSLYKDFSIEKCYNVWPYNSFMVSTCNLKIKVVCRFLIFPLHKVSDTRAVPLRLTPKLLKSLCILLVHMAFICNWFVSVTVNAIRHEHIRRLSLSLCIPCFPSGSPFQSDKIQGKNGVAQLPTLFR